MSQPNRNQKVLTGFITKVLGEKSDYGFIDSDIFFQQVNVIGAQAKVGDRVYAECHYSENLPFKWNASKVRVLETAPSLVPDASPTLVESRLNDSNNNSSINRNNFSRESTSINRFSTDLSAQQQHSIGARQPPPPPQPPNRPLSPSSHFSSLIQQQQQQHREAGTLDPSLSGLYAQAHNAPEMFGSPSTFARAPPEVFQGAGYLMQPRTDDLDHQGSSLTNQIYQSQQAGSAFGGSKFAPASMHGISPGVNNRPGPSQSPSHNQEDIGARSHGAPFQKFRPRWNENEERTERRGRFAASPNRIERRTDRRRFDDTSRSRRSTSRNRSRHDRSPQPSTSKTHRQSRSSSRSSSISSRQASTIRRYKPQYVPRSAIITPYLSTLDLKTRCNEGLHIPSDLKEVMVNVKFRLALRHIRKPIDYLINKRSDNEDTHKTNKSNTKDISGKSSKNGERDSVVKLAKKPTRIQHKYGVKILLISVPPSDVLFDKLFGAGRDSFSNEKFKPLHLNEILSFLCCKGSNDGYSLIGAKFDPSIDGFLEGDSDVNPKPNLIATCIRAAREQANLDLSACIEWNHLATFIYNQKEDYFSEKAAVEYSCIYMPSVWSILDKSIQSQVAANGNLSSEMDDAERGNETNAPESEVMKESGTKVDTCPDLKDQILNLNAQDLSKLKVPDIRAELDKRKIEYKSTLKKAELLAKLRDTIEKSGDSLALTGYGTHETNNEGEKSPKDLSKKEEPKESESSDSDKAVSGIKRKERDNSPVSSEIKKLKNEVPGVILKIVVEDMKESSALTIVPLKRLMEAQKYDQFELPVSMTLFKEFLVQEFAEEVASTVINSYLTKKSKNEMSETESKSETKLSALKEDSNKHSAGPVTRYIDIAFTYFDCSHVGYLLNEDLVRILQYSGYTLSKRAITAVCGENERYNYIDLIDGHTVYKFPDQFKPSSARSGNALKSCSVFERDGIVYDVDKILAETKKTEQTRVRLTEAYVEATSQFKNQGEKIKELQSKYSSANDQLKKQSDELSKTKQDVTAYKKKYDSLLRSVETSVESLTNLIKPKVSRSSKTSKDSESTAEANELKAPKAKGTDHEKTKTEHREGIETSVIVIQPKKSNPIHDDKGGTEGRGRNKSQAPPEIKDPKELTTA